MMRRCGRLDRATAHRARTLGFVLSQLSKPCLAFAPRPSFEAAHCEFAARQRAPLIAVKLGQAFGEVVPFAPLRIEMLLGLPHPHHLDMRGGDPVGALAALGARTFTGERALESRDRARELRIEPRRARKTVAERIAC